MRFRHSVEHAGFVSGTHVLDVDECVFTTVHFEDFKRLLDVITKVQRFALAILDLVAQVGVFDLHQIEDGQNLSVVGHQGLSNSV